MLNGQYSFVDDEDQMLYTTSTPFVAQFDISNGNANFVKKFTAYNNDSVLQGWAYDSQSRMVLAVGASNLYQYSIDKAWQYQILTSKYPQLSSMSMATMDTTNSNYLTMQSDGSE